MIRSSPIEAARARHPLADVARRTDIFLPTTAETLTVRCPIPAHGHPDRTPSMRLYLDDGRYYCFGCGAKGDVIQWVRDTEGLSVTDAIRYLDSGRAITNAWAGRPFDDHRAPAPTGSRAQPGHAEYPDLSRTSPERVRAALKDAWAFYSTSALHRRGSDYLASRGIDIGVLEEHNGRLEVGHAPPGPATPLVTALRSAGYDDDELVDAGLAQRYHPHGMLTEFYRERVLVPVYDEHGDVDGLIGRNVGDNRYPKYKNPPRTHIYAKSVNLYQPRLADNGVPGRVVIVEGTLDALALAVAAIRSDNIGLYPVTQSGRELSESQMVRIIGLHPTSLVLGFDGDRSGLDSATRYRLNFSRLGVTPDVAVLPQGHDPASWLASTGPDGLSVWLSTDVRPARKGAPQLGPPTLDGRVTCRRAAADIRRVRPAAVQGSDVPGDDPDDQVTL